MCDKCKDAMHKHYVCKCGKEFDNGISLQHHEMNCLKYKEWKKEQEYIKESKRLPNGLFKCENPDCNNEHDGSYGSGRFCCNKCRMHVIGKRSYETRVKNGNFVCNFNLKKYHANRSHKEWTCTICGEVFSTRSSMQQHRKDVHQWKKGMAWNKGLTKETSESIRLCAEKNSILLKGKSHRQTKETREKLSIARSRILDNPNSGGFKDVKWYHVSNLNGEDFVVRGHWEENVANKLTSTGVLWVRNKWLHYIKDGINRTYNPDFYLPNTNEYIEVKGYYSESDKEKMRLVLENNPGTRIYFIGQKQYQDFIDGKIILNDSLLLT